MSEGSHAATPAPAERVAPRPTAAHRAEYLALRGVVGLLGAVPWRLATALGAGLGTLGFRPLGIRRRVVERQIAAAFPDWPPERVLATAREAYAHLGRVTVETALLATAGPDRVLDLFEPEVDGWAELEAARALGRGIIFVSGHLGNWELGGAFLGARGLHVDAIARHMANPLVDRYMTATRTHIGMTVVHDDEAVRRAPRSLRAGGVVAFLADQGVLGLASTFVPFFGRPAKTPRGPAVFALRLGAPVFFGVALRQPSGKYRLSFERVPVTSTGDRDADVDATVAAYTRVLEEWVRRAPGQYFWHHRRWRRQPPGTPPELREPV